MTKIPQLWTCSIVVLKATVEYQYMLCGEVLHKSVGVFRRQNTTQVCNASQYGTPTCVVIRDVHAHVLCNIRSVRTNSQQSMALWKCLKHIQSKDSVFLWTLSLMIKSQNIPSSHFFPLHPSPRPSPFHPSIPPPLTPPPLHCSTPHPSTTPLLPTGHTG